MDILARLENDAKGEICKLVRSLHSHSLKKLS